MMDIIYNVLLIVAYLFFLLIPSKHALHMFQQNRYETGRYYKWSKEHYQEGIRSFAIYICILLLLRFATTKLDAIIIYWCLITLLVAFGLLRIINEKKKAYIKPLVYTGRVKRQIVVLAVLEIICISILVLIMNINNFALISLIIYLLGWVLIYVMALITNPIESAVKKHYKKLAKDILESSPDLIKIGITGSYGKTSSKNILQAILSEKYLSLMTPQSFNTPMGITITIRTLLKPIHQVFICEMGADHVGDIEELMDFVQPSIGMVTSIGPQHLNTFKSQENITNEKMKMIEMLPHDGVGIINNDNEFIKTYHIKNSCKLISYGIHNPADYMASDIVYSPQGTSFNLIHNEQSIPLKTKLLGEHNVANILAAICVSSELGLTSEEIQKAVSKIGYIEHRLEPKKINGYTFIDDAFNANPSGSKMALEVMKMMPGKRIIVTPGMIDLGLKQDDYNKAFGTYMKGCVDEVILVGQIQTKPIVDGLISSGFDKQHIRVVDNVKEAFAWVYQNASTQDTILLENDLPDAFKH